MPGTVDHIAQVSDAGIGGSKTYTGNYPAIILDTLRRPHGIDGLATEDVAAYLGAVYNRSCLEENLQEVETALKYLEDLDLVLWTGELWKLKKVKV